MLSHQQVNKKLQHGAAMVEFAIIVPFLLLLVLGIIEFGYAFYHLNILNKSVQDGARYFSDPLIARKGGLENAIDVSSGSNGTNITAATNLVIYGNVAGTGSSLMPTDASDYDVDITSPDTSHIQVTATYQHEFILGSAFSGIASMIGSTGNLTSFDLTASSVLRVE
jgi:Flp pilus assembly protein TadG